VEDLCCFIPFRCWNDVGSACKHWREYRNMGSCYHLEADDKGPGVGRCTCLEAKREFLKQLLNEEKPV
jgi:hypothetical protein